MAEQKSAIVAVSDPESRRSVTRILQNRSIKVVPVKDSHEARTHLLNSSPDMIIIDPELDGGRGLDLIQRARAQDAAGKMMIVLVAPRGVTMIRGRAERAGADLVVRSGYEMLRALSA